MRIDWVDYSSGERKKITEILEAIREHEALDELGSASSATHLPTYCFLHLNATNASKVLPAGTLSAYRCGAIG